MRYVANLIKKAVLETNPEFEGLLVPLCEYRNGMCTEMFPCEKAKTFKNKDSEKVDKIKELIAREPIDILYPQEAYEYLEEITEILYKDEEKESI